MKEKPFKLQQLSLQGKTHFLSAKENNSQPRILHPAKLSLGNDGEIKAFSDEEELREFVGSRSTIEK